jgi:hypothetical protein
MRQAEAAWRFGVSIPEYRELEAGTRLPTFETWEADLQAVRVAPDVGQQVRQLAGISCWW